MGVPAFFRWLSKKYPSIVVHTVEDKPKIVDGVKLPVDFTTPNPNGVEFDNLYLDMNGIIHPCCHPEDRPAPKNEDEMMTLIFEYIDRLMSIIRPRKLLYMAIDGVAPRAKMNQQRSRRFRASKETADKITEIEIFRNDLLSKGADLPAPKPKGEHFDSNCITPGTPFMDRLAQCLHYYIHDRMNTEPGWRNIKVILSDANVPGEGEHKIMDYIRRQRGNPDHDPNTSHCLCGADADLIMLGLATHEPNFTIIREEFKPNKPRSCDLCGQIGHEMKDCTGLAKEKQGEFDELSAPIACETDFIFLRLNVLREYLEKELTMHQLPFPFDLEGYLTDSGKVHLERVQLILTDLGEVEDEIFKNRQEQELAFQRRQKDKKKRLKMQRDRPAWTPRGQFAPTPIGNTPNAVANPRQEAYQMRMQGMQSEGRDSGNHAAANDLKAQLKSAGSAEDSAASLSGGIKRKWEHSNLDSDEEEQPLDEVRLWEDGWKDRYYENKFDVRSDNIKFRQEVAAEYCRGLCWVLKYYYQGCASWTWFFPYHYAPFASDFINIGDLNIEFDNKTQPFKPLEQLMGVFPAASKQHIPEPWGELMTDPESPIIDFYPDNFKIDLNGKKWAWQGVALLPFVDEKRLLKSLKEYYPLLTEAEEKRNVRGDDRLYINKINSGYDFMMALYEGEKNLTQELPLMPSLFGGVAGEILFAEDVVLPNKTLKSVLPGCPDITHNTC
uniref:5'-3' exoribonuclease n=1 Tax=Strigamia maritima TaxID=126957 RepID=T1J5Z8_STRMM